MAPELSVVIPSHNRCELLRECLASFEHQSAPAHTFEVVVVLDGSTDGSAEMVSKLAPPFELSVLTQPQAGASAARNSGAEHAKGRTLLFVDDDTTASPALVSAHLTAHRGQEDIAGVGVIARRIPGDADRFARLRAEAARAHYEHLLMRPLSYLDCYGGNCSVPRSLFAETAGFSVDLPVLNDLEFAYRLHEAGARFVFVPDAVVTEERQDDWRDIVADRELRGRTAAELYRRDPAIVKETEFSGNDPLRGLWVPLRAVFLALRVPPRLLAPLGFLVPGRAWPARWFAFLFSYSYWRGVAGAVGYRELFARLKRLAARS
jgi:glycosyltransferase involved in cell wall biosynthesis